MPSRVSTEPPPHKRQLIERGQAASKHHSELAFQGCSLSPDDTHTAKTSYKELIQTYTAGMVLEKGKKVVGNRFLLSDPQPSPQSFILFVPLW